MEEGAIKGQVSESTLQPGSAAAVRALEILLADRERSGDLDSDRVDSLMDKRSLDATERVWVYRQLGMDLRASAVEAGLAVFSDQRAFDRPESPKIPQKFWNAHSAARVFTRSEKFMHNH
jgi:hypothetical protein